MNNVILYTTDDGKSQSHPVIANAVKQSPDSCTVKNKNAQSTKPLIPAYNLNAKDCHVATLLAMTSQANPVIANAVKQSPDSCTVKNEKLASRSESQLASLHDFNVRDCRVATLLAMTSQANPVIANAVKQSPDSCKL